VRCSTLGHKARIAPGVELIRGLTVIELLREQTLRSIYGILRIELGQPSWNVWPFDYFVRSPVHLDPVPYLATVASRCVEACDL